MHLYLKKPLVFILLLCSFKLFAQDAAPKPVPLFFEKVYLHTDREQYLAGENIWFKAYLVNAQNNKLINTSNNLYVELIAPGGVIRNKELLRLDDGHGNGDFKLSDSIYAGTYRLRAYTNWMRNFGDNFVFEKEIKIYGGKKQKPKPRAIARNKNNQTKPITEEPLTETVNPEEQNTIRFFAEGGAMVEGVAGTVAFKAEDGYGRAVGFKGAIETETGTKVTDVSSANGTGAFSLLPVANTQYFAVGKYANGDDFKIPLPEALSRGVAMHVNNADSVIDVAVSLNQAAFDELKGTDMVLALKSRGIIYQTVRVALTGLQNSARLAKSNLPQGVACITLYDDSHRPNCERLVYIDKGNEPGITIITDKAAYTPKEKATVTLKSQPNALLSVAVTDAGLIAANQLDVASYLNLTSELRGKVNNPCKYFDKNDPDRKQQLDLLLLTQGWRDFVWRKLADSALRISYMLERGITINGHVKELFSEKPAPNMNVTIFADSATGTKLFSARTNDNGDFFIDGVNLRGVKSFGATVANDKGRQKGWISVDTTTKVLYPVKKVNYPPDTLPAAKKFMADVEDRMATSKKFSLSDTIKLHEVDIKSNHLPIGKTYGDSIIQITRDKYRYRTLGAFIGMLRYQMRDKFPRGIFFKNVFTCDSLPAWKETDIDGNYIINFGAIPLDQIISVHVRPLKLWGQPSYEQQRQGFIGRGDEGNYFMWIDLKAKANAFEKFSFHRTDLDIDGYYNARVFYAPKYETASTRPDVRTTIHWEPNITTDKNGEATITYYNADPKTKVRIVAEGVTEKGQPVVATAVYEVK